ncbi:uracil-DNA glycosylase [Buchnera aphidicola]|uniref:uracil-DNA glycosylase n=1 Tax=Buchnera aphidicola TaxID=9 RepID=UPI003463D59B
MNWKYIFFQERGVLSKILLKVKKERLKKIIYPPEEDVFNAFYLTPFNTIKVVIIGQDPYFHKDQAHGLAFSVRSNCSIPPSLKNIYKEVINDLSFPVTYYRNGCLDSWARQGILLLNSVLTVVSGCPRSHIALGWEDFTNKIIWYINIYLKNVIFLLWGNDAQQKKHIIDSKKHHILKTSHPSPFSAHLGFLGCRHFSKVNKILINQGRNTILW